MIFTILAASFLAIVWYALSKWSGGYLLERDRAVAHLLELGIYADQPRVTLRVLADLIGSSLALGSRLVKPAFLFLLPLVLVLLPLWRFNDYRPVRPGEATLLVAHTSGSAPTLSTSEGVRLDAGPLKLPEGNGYVWRVRPQQAGVHALVIAEGEQKWSKTLTCSDQPTLVSTRRAQLGLHWQPFESALPSGGPVESIELLYPRRQFWLGDRLVPWLLPFLGAFVVAGLCLSLLEGLHRRTAS